MISLFLIDQSVQIDLSLSGDATLIDDYEDPTVILPPSGSSDTCLRGQLFLMF